MVLWNGCRAREKGRRIPGGVLAGPFRSTCYSRNKKIKKTGGIIMMKKKLLVEIEKTRKGYPATWECGGGYTNTGEAIIIASQSGGPKKPIYIRRRGHLANDNHALFILELGDY